MSDLQSTLDEISALTDLLVEQRRARDIALGRDPDRPQPTADEIRAEALTLRERNDAAEATRQRRTTLKLVRGTTP